MAIWTQADLDALKAAIASGHKSVTVGGVTRVFHDLDSMRALLAEINRQLTDAPTHRVARVNKGL